MSPAPAIDEQPEPFGVRVFAVWMLGIIVLGVVGFLIGIAFGVRGQDIGMLAWAIATIWLCSIPLALDQARAKNKRHIVFSVVALGFALRFAMPVLTYYIPAVGPIDSPDLPHSNLMPPDIMYAQGLLFFGFAVFMLGYATPVGRSAARTLPVPKYNWTPNGSIAVAITLISFGWILFLGSQFGIIPASLGSGLIGAFSDATLFGPAILAIAYLQNRSVLAMAIIFVIVPITSGFNFFTGYKRLVLTPPAMIGLSWIVFRRRLQMRWLVLGFVALLSLYPAAQFYREVILDNNTRTLADVARNPAPALEALGGFLSSTRGFEYLGEGLEATGTRLDGVGHAAVIIRDTPDIVPFQGGWTIALVPITYIPRAIWPSKPVINIGAWIIDNYRIVGYQVESSIGPTWVGEFYMNFGVWGIAPGMLIFGFLLRFCHEALVTRAPTSLTLVLETVLIYQMFLKLTGSVATVINGPILTMIPIFIGHFAIRLFGAARQAEKTQEARPLAPSLTGGI